MDTSRLLLAILLSLGLVFAYQELVLKKMYPPQTQKAGEQIPTAAASGAITAAGGATTAPSIPTIVAPTYAALAGTSKGPEKLIEVDTALYHAVFTTHGGRLKSLRLKQYRETAASDSPAYDMVQASPNRELPLGRDAR